MSPQPSIDATAIGRFLLIESARAAASMGRIRADWLVELASRRIGA